MILDFIDNCGQYVSYNKGFEKAFGFIKNNNLKELNGGRYEINKDTVFALAYGSSITHGSGAISYHNSYVNRAAK